MTDIAFPPNLAPRRIDWRLERNVVTYESPLTNFAQRRTRSGPRWRAVVEMGQLERHEAASMTAWLDAISRAENAGLMPAFHNYVDAGFAAAEGLPLSAPWVEGGYLAWSGGLSVKFFPSNYLYLLNFPIASGFSRSFAVGANLRYAVVLDVLEFTESWAFTVTGATFTQPVEHQTQAGRFVYPLAPTGTTLTLRLHSSADSSAPRAAVFGNVGVFRILEVLSPAAAGAQVLTLAGDDEGDEDGKLQLSQGQFINVLTDRGWELKRLAAPAFSLPGGNIRGAPVNVGLPARLEPPLIGAAAANAPVIHGLPFCRMRLAQPVSGALVDAPRFHGFTFELVEDLNPVGLA